MVIQRRYKEILLVMATFIGNLWTGQQAAAQTPSSLYFTSPQPKNAEFITSPPKKWHGTYKSERDTTLRLYISHDSIYTESPFPIFISVPEAANRGYTVMDSLIVVENDTLPCWVHQDTAYFFIYLTKSIYKKTDKEKKLYPFEDYLLLSSQNADGNWETMLFIHGGMVVELAYFDHSEKETELQKKKKIKRENKSGMLVYYASFKEKEWKNMLSKEWFPSRQRFNKYN